MILSSDELKAFVQPLTSDQVETITRLRDLILASGLELNERVETGKWYTGLLVYEHPAVGTVYALGPLTGGNTTFHMMPFYGSAPLQERHSQVLKPLLSGKSCIKLRNSGQVPVDAIRDILAAGPAYVEVAAEMLAGRKPKPDRPKNR